jgi:hypothetical protein
MRPLLAKSGLAERCGVVLLLASARSDLTRTAPSQPCGSGIFYFYKKNIYAPMLIMMCH